MLPSGAQDNEPIVRGGRSRGSRLKKMVCFDKAR